MPLSMLSRWSFRLLRYSIIFLALLLVLLLGLKHVVGRQHAVLNQPKLPERIEAAISLLLNQNTQSEKTQGQACSLASTANATLGVSTSPTVSMCLVALLTALLKTV